MEYLSIQLDDLPDEILLIIFKNLNNIDLLNSLIGVNKRLNKIVHDSIFTNSLTLFGSLSCDYIDPLPDLMLNRFCLQILPEIHNNIKWLKLEFSSMKRILLSGNYPNLFGLGLYNIAAPYVLNLFNDKNLMHKYKNQISSLVIKTITKEHGSSSSDMNTLIFKRIFNIFTNLQNLNIDPLFHCHERISFNYLPPTVFSSTLLELRIKVESIDDCLYILDDFFHQLRTLYVDIQCSVHPWPLEINTENLPNLRCFSLYFLSELRFYDKIIVPLLHRMSNLEELNLYLSVDRNNRFIDGDDLQNNILNYMRRLNQFRFNIRSTILLRDQIDLQSNEDIEHSFKDFSNNQIISCVNYFQEAEKGQCHIYSYPFTIPIYENISNNFPGGSFTCVCEVSLFDEHPFEHEFFIRITQSFPFMKKLTIRNQKPQKNKHHRKLKNNNQDLSIIKYPHLKCIIFNHIHDDYVELSLLDTKTYLPYDVSLYIDYKPLKRVIHKFTRKATRINCAKLRYVCFDRIVRFSKHFKDYFLDIKMDIV